MKPVQPRAHVLRPPRQLRIGRAWFRHPARAMRWAGHRLHGRNARRAPPTVRQSHAVLPDIQIPRNYRQGVRRHVPSATFPFFPYDCATVSRYKPIRKEGRPANAPQRKSIRRSLAQNTETAVLQWPCRRVWQGGNPRQGVRPPL